MENLIKVMKNFLKNEQGVNNTKGHDSQTLQDPIKGTKGSNGTNGSETNSVASSQESVSKDNEVPQLPLIPKVESKGQLNYKVLPKLLQKVVNIGKGEIEKEVVLVSAITFLSSIAPSVSFNYGSQKYFLNLYLFVVARAGSGKGIVGVVKNILNKVDDHLRTKCDLEWSLYEKQKASPFILTLSEPKCGGLFSSEDQTRAALIDSLEESTDYNMIFSSEAISASTKGEMFDTRDILLKASEHERVSEKRKGKRERIFDEPKLSLLLTGTESSVQTQASGKEDGMFSRFMWYSFGGGVPKWKSQHNIDTDQLNSLIEEVSDEVLDMHLYIIKHPFKFKLSLEQQSKFDALFTGLTDELDLKKDNHYESFINRLAHKFYRIAGVITMCSRFEHKRTTDEEVCSDEVFNFVYELVHILNKKAKVVFHSLKGIYATIPIDTVDRVLDLIPMGKVLKRDKIEELLEPLGIVPRSITNHLNSLVKSGKITKLKKGVYKREHT